MFATGMGNIEMSSYTSPAPVMRGDLQGPIQLSSMSRGPGRGMHTTSCTRSSEAHPDPRHQQHNSERRADDFHCNHGYYHNPRKWMIPLCYEPKDDVNTCCLGCWCPQILYGRTQYRLRQMARNQDPLDLKDYKIFNAPCMVFWILGAFTNFDCKLKSLQETIAFLALVLVFL